MVRQVVHSLLGFSLMLALAWTTPPEQTTQPGSVPAPVLEPAEQSQPLPAPPPPNRNRGLGVMIVGISIFVGGYGGSLLLSTLADKDAGRALRAPLVGPFVAIALEDYPNPRPIYAVLGAVQVGALAMAIAGGVMFGRSRRQAPVAFMPGGLQLRF